MSDIAEYCLNNLFVFRDQVNNWLKFADSRFVYSRNSQDNIEIYAGLSEEGKKEFNKIAKEDKYEVHNYCNLATDIIKILHEIIYRAKRLSDSKIDDEIASLEKYVGKLPTHLFNAHFLPNPLAIKEKAAESIRNASGQIEKDCSSIHDLLIDYLMFRKKGKKTT